ncbi:MarR family winged helix-turn-helix transcriptional regulator [Streptomyces purpureus]|uniref:HTH marR-type domain-containing protein n=1 Tax=Streptomyces purpureus TaxID=1951 RepID=A0A918H0F0_9ACTN|nr:MarR family transcriptional regulator [Streptomyces purpureus]GGT29125.1 hypothetical protein GCM10014713_23310 [Streptomyces purpureus]
MSGPTAGPPESGPGSLADALCHLQCVLVARRSRADPQAISWAQYDVLDTLDRRGGMAPSQLSASLGVSRPSMSKTLRFLKDRGLVAQTVAHGDRRELTTTLTEEGSALLLRAADDRRQIAALATGALTPGERSLFTELCEKVAEALHAGRAGA